MRVLAWTGRACSQTNMASSSPAKMAMTVSVHVRFGRTCGPSTTNPNITQRDTIEVRHQDRFARTWRLKFNT